MSAKEMFMESESFSSFRRWYGTVIHDTVSMFIMYIGQSVYVMKFKVAGSKCRFRTQRDNILS